MLTQFLENYPIDLTMNPALDFWKSTLMLIISGDDCYETCCKSSYFPRFFAKRSIPGSSDRVLMRCHQVSSNHVTSRVGASYITSNKQTKTKPITWLCSFLFY